MTLNIPLEIFTRSDYYAALKNQNTRLSAYALSYLLRKDVKEGKILHVGRNQYSFPKSKQIYNHEYSPEAQSIAKEINLEYPEISFQIFELTQLNNFVNHQIAHNTIFISVENEAIDYVFDSLRRNHAGKILLKPSVNEYYRYLVEDQIVILRLASEAPKGISDGWESRLEKILVDVTVDKLLTHIVPGEEYENIFEESFARYLLNVNTMLRYANRRGAAEKFKTSLNKYAPTLLEGTI